MDRWIGGRRRDQGRGDGWSCNQGRRGNGGSQGRSSKGGKRRRIGEGEGLDKGTREDDGGKRVRGGEGQCGTMSGNGCGWWGPNHGWISKGRNRGIVGRKRSSWLGGQG